MKKLMFAIAGAAAFAAFAGSDPAAGEGVISLVGFEAYTTNTTVLGYNDQGQSGNSLWTSTGDDESRVQAYGGDNATAPSALDVSFPAPFTEVGAGDNYLALDTSGAELQRLIPNDQGQQTIPAGGTYIDTLVQFTVTEDEEPTIDDTTKLAIWMGVGDGATNLYVKGGYMVGPVGEGGVTIDTTDRRTYKLDSVVEPGAWYRLTVKAVVIDNDGAGNYISGYQVFIDGTRATSETAVCDEAAVQYYTKYANADGIFPGAAGLLSAKTIIPSCAGVQSDATITSVGFQGTGAIDDFVVTTNDPFPPSVVDFTLTLTLGSNVTSAEVTTNGVEVVFDNGTARIREGTVVSIAQPVFATNYHLDGLTTNTVAVASPTFPFAFTMTEAIEVEITAAEDQVSYPTYIDTTDATIKGKYDTWKATYQADTQSAWETAFLLNMDPTESVAAGTALLKIASITEVSGGWELEIVSDATTLTAETNNDGLVGNGYLAITYAADLATLTSGGTTVNLPVTVTDGKIKVTVSAPGAKFMKATLTSTPAPASQE